MRKEDKIFSDFFTRNISCIKNGDMYTTISAFTLLEMSISLTDRKTTCSNTLQVIQLSTVNLAYKIFLRS